MILHGQKNVKVGYFATFWQFSQKRSDHFSLFLCIQLLGDDIDQLSRDGFDLIIGKVIFNDFVKSNQSFDN